jgi:2-dehydropantoate 2-reductase
VPGIVDQFTPLLGPETAVVPAVNGLPWWYFYKANTGTALDDTHLETVDPGGAQWKTLGPERAIGCVVYPAADVPEPGVIQHNYGNRFSLGEPDGSASERLETLSKLMIAGGLKAPRKPRLRDEIWIKLWGNCSFNPVSALTGASLDLIGGNPACRDVIRRMMLECKAVGEAIGARFAVDVERRSTAARKSSATSPRRVTMWRRGGPWNWTPNVDGTGTRAPPRHRYPRPWTRSPPWLGCRGGAGALQSTR